jgi:hypothetical protein
MSEIGIFISKHKWNCLAAKRSNSGLAELVRAASVLSISPIWFSLPQTLLDQGILIGAVERHGIIEIGPYPLPKVIYDLGVFKKKDRPAAKKLRTALAEQQVKLVNSRSAFSKWSTHIALAEDNSVLPHLPKTVRFHGISDLAGMLSIYPKICVKSLWGSRGKEVMFIEKEEKGLKLLYPNGSVQTFGQIEDLTGAISRFMGDNKFIIQQWIELAVKKNRRFDIRVLLQKVSLDRWDCTALCLRLALPGYGSTGTGQGSEVKQVLPLLKKLWPTRYPDIIAQIKEVAFKAAQTLEAKYGPLGELGIDIGIDSQGKVWLFEVNGKPGKTTVRKLKQDDLIQHAYQRPLLYAKMLLKENEE